MTKLIGAARSHNEDKAFPVTPTALPREVPDTDRAGRLVTDDGSPGAVGQATTWQR
jgi:hypothetical protein